MILKHKISTLVKLLLFITFLPVYANASKNIAIVIKVKGTVEILKAESEKFDSLQKGVHLDSGDKIKTGEDGFVALIFTDDKSLLRVRQNTEIVVEGKREAMSISKRVNMEIGALWVNIKERKGEFKVATPTSVASVKGTEFWILADINGNTNVICLVGLLELYNKISDRTIEINAGYTGTSTYDGELSLKTTKAETIPGDEDIEENELEIELEDEHGDKKNLIIKFK